MKKYNYYLLALLSLIVSFIFDRQIILFITSLRINILNTIMIAINYITTENTLFIAITLILLLAKKYKEIPVAWLALIIPLAITFLLKLITHRLRPFEALQIEQLVNVTNSSFPSGHATASFSGFVVLTAYIKKLKYLWLFLAILIMFSRLYLGLHYISDVIAGSVIGYGISYVIIASFNKYSKKKVK